MKYQERRRARRAEVKAVLLIALRDSEAYGMRINLADLAIVLGRSASSLRVFWQELADEGQIAYPADARLRGEYRPVVTPADLERRIAAVRAAKIDKRIRERKNSLTGAELERILP
jgi:hypothetical protein